jgi:Ca2+-binding RTX toxin-like protein
VVVFGIALAVLVSSPVAASASRARVINGSALDYAAGSGESNDVNVSLDSGAYTITDSGAAITAGAGCGPVDSHRVRCSADGVGLVTVAARDQNDAVSVSVSTSTLIEGGLGNDTLVGGSGVDFLDGDAGNDILGGGESNDLLTGGFGADYLSGGGGGFDTASYFERGQGVVADIGGGANDGNGGDGAGGSRDNIESDVENIAGGGGNDVLTGDAGRNSLWGGGGGDSLRGEDGNDTLSGDAGADSLSGGAGTGDFVSYTDSDHTAGVVADIGGGPNDGNNNDGSPGARDDIHTDVEHLSGGIGDDVLSGDDHANILDGSGGGDSLNGLAGDDFLLGSDGSDSLNGGPDGDVLDGGFGDDNLSGEDGGDILLQSGSSPDGADAMSGGEGADRADYSFRSAAVVADPGGGQNDGGDANGDRVAEEGDNIGGDIEGITGGAGNDAITGDYNGNRLEGGGGSDALQGLGGDDLLVSRDGVADSVGCGDGQDSVTADGQDAVHTDCELVEREGAGSGGSAGSQSALPPGPLPTLTASGAASATPALGTTRKACAGLKGKKLKRCKALARCKKLRGAKRKRCRALARCKGLKRAKRRSCLRKARRVGRK